MITFDEFLTNPKFMNEWVREEGLEIYVRKSLPYRGLIMLANMKATSPGHGAFKRFLASINHLPLIVESVITDRFADFFRREGWAEIPCPYAVPSFLNSEAMAQGLGPVKKVKNYPLSF